MQVRSRSGLAAKHGVFVTNGPGTIDPDYRGEIKILLSCVGPVMHKIGRGDRIAQLVLAPVLRGLPIAATHLTDTSRGSSGFGSTGS
jgi:dUTP pyrophosphatase